MKFLLTTSLLLSELLAQDSSVISHLIPFTFVASEWPSVAASTDGLGYCVPPTANSTLLTKFPYSTDPSLNIALNPVANTQACPTGVDLTPYGSTGSCWWTCGSSANGGNCLRATDISDCKVAGNIGITFDDGPLGSWTLTLLAYLQANNLRATFFLVGANLVQHADIAQTLLKAGMELGVHTWSHHPLTSQSNDVVTAELGYTIMAFQRILGITPKLFRPPQGDFDDRIRAIAKGMGLTPVIWNVDTNDFTTDGHTELVSSVVSTFENLLNTGSYPNGLVVLEHDYFQGGVDLATGTFLPFYASKGLKMKSIGQCLGWPDNTWYTSPYSNAPNGNAAGAGTDSASPKSVANASSSLLSNWIIVAIIGLISFVYFAM